MFSSFIRKTPAVAVLQCSGRITLGEGNIGFREQAKSLIYDDDSYPNLVIDLTNVDYIDSSGMGELLLAIQQASKIGSTVRLAGAKKEFQDYMLRTKYQPLLEFYPTQDDAVNSFIRPTRTSI